MTPGEWESVVGEVAALWGRSAKWAKADQAYRHAQSIPGAAAHKAVQEIFLENRKQTPSPADVLSAARSYVSMEESDAAQFCTDSGRHLWAILNESAGIREVRCARCGKEEERAAHTVPTEGEDEDGVFADQRVGPDRIAP